MIDPFQTDTYLTLEADRRDVARVEALRPSIRYQLDRAKQFDEAAFERAVEAGDSARDRKAEARRQETERLIAAVHADRMAQVERVARMVMCGARAAIAKATGGAS